MTILLGATRAEFETFIDARRSVSDPSAHATGVAWVFDSAAKRMLLLSHRVHGWSCPGGHLESDEEPYEAAVRELKEETGVAATPLSAEPAVVVRRVGCPRTPDEPVVHWTFGYRFEVSSNVVPVTEAGQPGRWWSLAALPHDRAPDIDEVLAVLDLGW